MTLNKVCVVSVLFGIITSCTQLMFLLRVNPYFSDLSSTNATIYIINLSFIGWLILTATALDKYGKRAWWILFIAPTALIGPVVFMLFVVGIAITGDGP